MENRNHRFAVIELCNVLTPGVYVPMLLWSIVVTMFSQEVHAQTLDDYLIEAAENNPGLKASYLEFEAALQKSAQVKAIPDPVLSFGYFVSPVETRVGPQRAKFSLVQMFPWFGTNESKAQIYEFNALAKYQEFVDRKNELFYRVKKAYYPIYEVKEHIKWQKENLEILNTYKRLATNSFSNNKGAMVDVIRVDIMIDNATTELQLLMDKQRPLEIALNRLLNRHDTLGVNVPEVMELNAPEIVYTYHDLVDNPLLRTVDLKIEEANAMEQAARKQGLPALGVGVDYVFVDQRTDFEMSDNGKNVLMPMISTTLPLFRSKYNASIKEAQLEQLALVQKRVEIENQLTTSLVDSKYELEKANQMVILYDTQVLKATQAKDLLYSSYANSGEDFEEVLRAEQQLLTYNISKATATKDYFIATAKLKYITAKSEQYETIE